MSGAMEQVLVNLADWDGPEVPQGWPIANAPRPLQGQLTWQGQFRHGIFYAAAPESPEGTFGWAADDAWLVVFIGNEEIRERIAAKLAEYDIASLDEAGLTEAEVASMLNLPWHEETAR